MDSRRKYSLRQSLIMYRDFGNIIDYFVDFKKLSCQ